ncbi:MAG: small multi-drug export protein [Thermoplasmatota archaeon]
MNASSKDKKYVRLLKFFVPFILGFGVLGIWWLFDDTIHIIWPLIVAYFFPPFGKETIIPLGIGLLKEGLTIPLLNIHVQPVSVNPISIALAIAFVDVIVALFLVWNYDLAKKIPLIGKFIIKIEEKGKGIEKKYSWIKPLRFVGIVLFVMFPFQGSGGLVGSVVGRLFGMKPWNVFYAISIGSVTGCLLIAMFSTAFLIFTKINTVLTISIVLIIVAIIVIIYLYKTKLRKNVIR